MNTSKFKDLSSTISKHVPEKIDTKLCLFNLRMAIGSMQQYLEDHPGSKEKIRRLLKEGDPN